MKNDVVNKGESVDESIKSTVRDTEVVCDNCPRTPEGGRLKLSPEGTVLSHCSVVSEFVEAPNNIKSYKECPKFLNPAQFRRVSKT